MAYIRLIVLVLVFEVLITATVGIGIYFGFSIFPFSQFSITTNGIANHSVSFFAVLPLYMPSLSDLKIPYTYLHAGIHSGGITAFVVSVALLVLQSFLRAMYLGGLKEWILNRKIVPLLPFGRKYFGSMLAWSIFQNGLGALVLLIAAAFFPIGLILIIALMFYSLTPYLIVLQDISFGEALAKSPRILRRYFGSLLPLTLLAMFCTFITSLFQQLTSPWGYAIPLLAYIGIGTLLIGELMRQLSMKLTKDDEQISDLPFLEVRNRRTVNVIFVLLVPVLVTAGIFAASGRHLGAFDFGSKKLIDGIAYNANFSDVFYSSKQRYTAYEWQSGDYSIATRLPDLSSERKPDEIRGIADITWQVNEEFRSVRGNSTQIDVKPSTHKNRLMYRLVRETINGNIYYSSMNGSASILPGGVHPYEPLSVQIMVSGDGTQLFVTQYPTRFDGSQVFRVSADGRFLIPGTSQTNPMDFHNYWFTSKQSTENLFDMLTNKNIFNAIETANRSYLALASALQEGDGRMVIYLLERMRQAGVNVKAPDWDELTWNNNLRDRYKGTSLEKTMEFLTKAGIQNGYVPNELSDQSNEKVGVYRFEIPFPDGMLPITYSESKEDGKLLSLNVLGR